MNLALHPVTSCSMLSWQYLRLPHHKHLLREFEDRQMILYLSWDQVHDMVFKVLKAVIYLTFAVILVTWFCSSSFLIQKPRNHSKRVAKNYNSLSLNESTSLRATKESFIADSNYFMRRMEERMSRRRLHIQRICKAKGKFAVDWAPAPGAVRSTTDLLTIKPNVNIER